MRPPPLPSARHYAAAIGLVVLAGGLALAWLAVAVAGLLRLVVS